MPTPLPLPGFTDTGITCTTILGADAQMLLAFSDGGLKSGSNEIQLGGWRMWDSSAGVFGDPDACPPGQYKAAATAHVEGPNVAPTELERTLVGACHNTFSVSIGDFPDRVLSAEYHMTETTGPFRLGVAYILRDATIVPKFADSYDLAYCWFADGYTIKDTSFGPVNAPRRYFNGLAEGSLASPDGVWLTTQNEAETPACIEEIGKFPVVVHVPTLYEFVPPLAVEDPTLCTWVREMKITAGPRGVKTVPTDEIDDGTGHIVGSSGGNITGTSGECEFSGVAKYPHIIRYNLDVTKNGGVTTAARVEDNLITDASQQDSGGDPLEPYEEYLTMPYADAWELWTTSWYRELGDAREVLDENLRFEVQAAWAASQSWDDDDLQLPIRGAPALEDPEGVAGEPIPYFPCLLTFPDVNVNRPRDNTSPPSNWISSDGAKIAVTENALSTTFVVSDPSAYVERTFVEHWRNWVGLGAGGTGHADFGFPKYEVTKSNFYGNHDDIWAWQHHGTLRVVMDGPVSAGNVALLVTGNHLAVYDPHTTGADRVTGYTATLTPYTASYSFAVNGAASATNVKLCYPTGTQPFYHGRVDKLRLTFPAAGTYVLTTLKLTSLTDIYIKNDYGAPVPRKDYSALTFIMDGAFSLGEWGDKLIKPDETGERGGYVRYIDVLTGSGTGIIMDTHRALENFWENLDYLEGFDAEYSSSNFDASNRDAFGNALSPELAQWLWPMVPHETESALSTFQPPCSPAQRNIRVTNIQPFLLRVLFNGAHMAFEKLVATGSGPDVGRTVRAVRVSDSAVVASGVTDGNGYVYITPVLANGDIEYRLEEV